MAKVVIGNAGGSKGGVYVWSTEERREKGSQQPKR